MGLVSSFFLVDYKMTNTTLEKRENLPYVKMKLLVGLALTAFGYTLSSIGVDEQVKKLMPRQQHLIY